MLKMQELDLRDKCVLIRLDLNVPLQNGHIQSDARIQAALPTIQLAVSQKASVMLMSHLGRPKEGIFDAAFSLNPVAIYLSALLKQQVKLVALESNTITPSPGEIVLLENVRFNKGEKANDPALAKKLASLCDVFVMDAFGSSHRAHASTVGVAEYAKVAAAGPLLLQELENLSRLFQNPKRPLIALVGGAKVSTKIHVLESLIQKVDVLILGGGIANTFLVAKGFSVGESLYEQAFVEEAKRLLILAESKKVKLPLPKDVVVAKTLSDTQVSIKKVTDILPQESVFDVGPETTALFCEIVKEAGTIVWNGPLGAFEVPTFGEATKRVAEAVAASNAWKVAGGGDTVSAIEHYHIEKHIDYLSTGGGAFLEFMEGKTLPAVEVLERRIV